MTKVREIPKGFDVYRVKGIVGRLFKLKPMCLRLIWETGEWDPVAGYEDELDDPSDDEARGHPDSAKSLHHETQPTGKWMKREVEIEDSTRQIGFCVDGNSAKVRVELRK